MPVSYSVLLMKVVDFNSRLLAFRGAGGEPHSLLGLLDTRGFLLLRLKVKATGVSFLVACLTRCISSGRHAPSIQINNQRRKNLNATETALKKEM